MVDESKVSLFLTMKLNELFTYFSIAYLFSLVNGCIIKQIFPEPIPLNNFKSPNVWPSIFNSMYSIIKLKIIQLFCYLHCS